jgi:uncharacterized protein
MWLAEIHTYPIKGCYRVEWEQAEVEPWGLAGDRRWLVVDPETGLAMTQRDIRAMTQVRPGPVPGGLRLRAPGVDDLMVTRPAAAELIDVTVWSSTVAATPAGDVADDWLSIALDRKVRLVWLDDPTRRAVEPGYGQPGDTVSFADGYPLLLANIGSLAVLNDLIAESESAEGPLPITRFRPNLVIGGAPAWAEDGWTGRRIRVGGVTFRVPKPCGRCVVTTTDQESGERGREPLHTLGRHRNVDQSLLFGANLIPDARGTVRVGDPVEPV